MITGSLQKKKGLYYAVLNLYNEYGKWKPKWIPTSYAIKGNKKKAEEKLEQFKIEYENKSKIQLRDPNIYDKYKNVIFIIMRVNILNKHIFLSYCKSNNIFILFFTFRLFYWINIKI